MSSTSCVALANSLLTRLKPLMTTTPKTINVCEFVCVLQLGVALFGNSSSNSIGGGGDSAAAAALRAAHATLAEIDVTLTRLDKADTLLRYLSCRKLRRVLDCAFVKLHDDLRSFQVCANRFSGFLS